jgi:hypothetical protein
MTKMKDGAYLLALAAAIAFGLHQRHSTDEDKQSRLSAARAANEQIQLAMQESKCGDPSERESLCTRLKQVQADVDNTIYRINGGTE